MSEISTGSWFSYVSLKSCHETSMAEASHGDKVSHYHWLSFLIMLIKTFDENDSENISVGILMIIYKQKCLHSEYYLPRKKNTDCLRVVYWDPKKHLHNSAQYFKSTKYIASVTKANFLVLSFYIVN